MVQCYLTGDHEGTLAPPGKYDWTRASFGPLESTAETANGSVQMFLHSLRQKVPILYNGRPCPPELSLSMGDLNLQRNTWCFGPMRVHNPNSISISAAVFAQMTAQCLCTMVCLFPPSKLLLSMLASLLHVIHGSLGPPDSRTQMATWSFQPFLQGSLVWHTNKPTERPTDQATWCDAA